MVPDGPIPVNAPTRIAAWHHPPVIDRSWLVNVAAGLLLVGGLLLLYVSWPTFGPIDGADGGLTALGLGLAAIHFAGAVGVTMRRGWGRLLGLIAGWIGLFGSGSVLLTMVAGLGSMDEAATFGLRIGPEVLAIPAAMAAAYVLIVVALLRGRAAFEAYRGQS